MYTFNFEKLEVWKNSRLLARKIYQKTDNFPDNEKFGLTNQIRRAAVSVCSNIAEGSSRISTKEQMHFYSVAYSSLMETINQLILSNDMGYIIEDDLLIFRKEVNSIGYMLSALRKSLKNKL